PEDIEISGFIAACFAYGKVDLFKPVIRSILNVMDPSPHDFLLDQDICKKRELFAGLRYRFNRNEDIVCLLYVLGETLRKHGSIESVFKSHYRGSDTSIEAGLTGMTETLLGIDTAAVYGDGVKPKGFEQFFPSPARGSACKRMNMFLRWMIRDRDIDFGIWKGMPKNRLVIPLDVHIARISRCLGFTSRSSGDWKTAVEITESLKKMDPEDPLKYDFALCHQGIARICSLKRCDECNLFRTL
ncbi:MAG: TIGR02757 family protein, partial [Nitrospirae bacterium]|nr:TIGR02757 family protein [Nitrospirota bacterium]